MKTDVTTRFRAYIYLRLSKDEYKTMQESDSIVNQRLQIKNYCKLFGITILDEYVDDGISGATFERPSFDRMLSDLSTGKANMVITKDLSRLGRDMNEASYYAERYFPEMGVCFLAINDNFDSTKDNYMAPVYFFMNEMYLRDGSKKVKATLKAKRENGLYCACSPYGYRKADDNNNLLVPDPETSEIVKRIFYYAADGESTMSIAEKLTNEVGVNLKQGYNGDLTSKQAGSVGGQMVKKMCPERPFTFDRVVNIISGERRRVTYLVSVVG